MAHPDLLTRAAAPDAFEQSASPGDIDEGTAEFAMVGGLGFAAELRAHHHLAIANSQYGNALLEHQIAARAASSLRAHWPDRRTG